MWVKVCGLTDPEEAYQISRMGVDAIGLVFYSQSPRALTIIEASAVAIQILPGVLKVGVFVDPDWRLIREAVHSVSLDMIQWHGGPLSDSDLLKVSSMGVPWIDVCKVKPEKSESLPLPPSQGASMVLVEGFNEKSPGGSHTKWNYGRISGLKYSVPLVLSGGLDPETVKKAIQEVSPFGVDVSSGVEKSPGRKDLDKVSCFLKEAGK